MHIDPKNTQFIKTDNSIELSVLRLDKLHPVVQGNKHYKLKYNLEKAASENKSKIITFGGAFSNHIHATAKAGQILGFETTGIIRGEKTDKLNFTLREASECGMKLIFISRDNYRRIRDNAFGKEFLENLLNENLDEYYIIPEGGSNELALKGSAEILNDIETDYDVICMPVGTGGTIAGIIKGLNDNKKVIGFSSLKGNFSHDDVSKLLEEVGANHLKNWEIINDYHFGGYGKWDAELIDFINEFYFAHHIPLCPIYTGKMIFGLLDLIKNNYFPKNTKILALHTGGLQGVKGFNEMNSNLLNC